MANGVDYIFYLSCGEINIFVAVYFWGGIKLYCDGKGFAAYCTEGSVCGDAQARSICVVCLWSIEQGLSV